MKKDYSIEAFKEATDKHLEDLGISKYIYCLTCSLAERLLAYSSERYASLKAGIFSKQSPVA